MLLQTQVHGAQQHVVAGCSQDLFCFGIRLAVDEPVAGLVVGHVKAIGIGVESRVQLVEDQQCFVIIGGSGHIVGLVSRGRANNQAAAQTHRYLACAVGRKACFVFEGTGRNGRKRVSNRLACGNTDQVWVQLLPRKGQ